MTSPTACPWVNRGLVVAILALLFAAGVGTGYGYALWSRTPEKAPADKPLVGLHYYSSLGLTTAQERSIQEIYQKYRPDLDAVLQESRPRVRVIHEKIEQEIRVILTPDQVRRLDEHKARRARDLKDRGKGAGTCLMEGACGCSGGGCGCCGGEGGHLAP